LATDAVASASVAPAAVPVVAAPARVIASDSPPKPSSPRGPTQADRPPTATRAEAAEPAEAPKGPEAIPAAPVAVGPAPTEPGTAAAASAQPAPPSQPETTELTPTPPAIAAGSGPEVERLVAAWPDIVKAVSPATRAVLTECRPIAVDGNVVTLGFPEAKAFLKDHAERRRTDVEGAIGGHLGRPVSVRTVATNIEVAPLAATDDLVAEARRIFADDLVDVGEVS
jgi:hypothetical protein